MESVEVVASSDHSALIDSRSAKQAQGLNIRSTKIEFSKYRGV